MTHETNQRRAELVNGRQVDFETLTRDLLREQKENFVRQVNIKPATRSQELYQFLCAHLGADTVTILDQERKMHGKDASVQHPAIPDIVVYPQRQEQVQWLVHAASERKVPLIPFGLGNSLEANIAAVQGGITVDLSRMSRVLEFYPEDHQIRVQAGITKNALCEYLKESNLFLPLDTGCDATIGGLIATNASGAGSLHYGSIRAHVLGLKVVMADGSIVVTGRRARRSSAGYDLNKLFVGAEGTLGIVLEATLQLTPVPRAITAAIASFDSLDSALQAVTHLMRQGMCLQRCDLLDEQAIHAINKFQEASFVEQPTLFLEAHGLSRASADLVIEECKDACRERGLVDFVQFADEDAEQPMLWKARASAWMAISRFAPGTELFVTDASVPQSRLAENIVAAKKDALRIGFQFAPIMGSVGDGNFHLVVPIRTQDRSQLDLANVLSNHVNGRAVADEGTCSGQHGIGARKRQHLELELGPTTVNVMRAIKRALDPNNIMNPGKVFYCLE